MREQPCSQGDCPHFAYIKFNLGYDERWYCFTHALELFEDWDGRLVIEEFPDRDLFETSHYPDELRTLATIYEHQDPDAEPEIDEAVKEAMEPREQDPDDSEEEPLESEREAEKLGFDIDDPPDIGDEDELADLESARLDD